MDTIHIYTDGACSGNPGPGGAAAVILIPSSGSRRVSKGFAHTTNNRMEIMAAIIGLEETLRFLPDATAITVHTDSQTLYGTMTMGWKKKANTDLWKRLDKTVDAFRSRGGSVNFDKVKGHDGNQWNELADRLAVLARSAGNLEPDSGYTTEPPAETAPAKTENIVKNIVQKYINESDVCMAKLLANEPVPQGMSFEDAFLVYVECMKHIDKDRFTVTREN